MSHDIHTGECVIQAEHATAAAVHEPAWLRRLHLWLLRSGACEDHTTAVVFLATQFGSLQGLVDYLADTMNAAPVDDMEKAARDQYAYQITWACQVAHGQCRSVRTNGDKLWASGVLCDRILVAGNKAIAVGRHNFGHLVEGIVDAYLVLPLLVPYILAQPDPRGVISGLAQA